MPDPTLCALRAPIFAKLGEISFRRAESDSAPVMLVPLDDKQAALPLRSMQREFGIADDSEDGRMLALIAEALEFVEVLRPGDPLPEEVLTGDASWQPASRYLAIALGKLRMRLLAWIDPGAAPADTANSADLDRLESDPAMRVRVQNAFEQAALALSLDGPEQAVATLGRIAQEMAYIESLRAELLLPVRRIHGRLTAFSPGRQIGSDRHGLLERARRLCGVAVERIGGRFDDVDQQTGELTTGLRNANSQCAFIRSNRDWLYRSKRAWDPVLRRWSMAPFDLDDGMWALVNSTYQFLAPRFMPAQEWTTAWSGARGARQAPKAMTW